jgi:hypothetical protein
MKVLIACEFSGVVREAFKARGHDAWSCDLLPTEIPGKHFEGDVFQIINGGWDLMIAHPPCTYLSYAGTRHWNVPGRGEKRREALGFFMALYEAPVNKICIENPVGYPNSVWRKPEQIIHPYYFGDPFQKRTCLWLKNLPSLKHDGGVKPPPYYLTSTKGKAITWTEGVTKDRAKERSKTFPGIARAMAEQWG